MKNENSLGGIYNEKVGILSRCFELRPYQLPSKEIVPEHITDA